MDFPADIAEFQRHYIELRGDESVPSLRAFIDNPPYSLMPRIAIIDLLGPNKLRARYFGTSLAQLLGWDCTGFVGPESPEKGLDQSKGSGGWIASNHQCGYLTRRILRRGPPSHQDTAFDLLTLSFPLNGPADLKCMVSYHSFPEIAPQVITQADDIASITPLAWVDIGSGVPAMKLSGNRF